MKPNKIAPVQVGTVKYRCCAGPDHTEEAPTDERSFPLMNANQVTFNNSHTTCRSHMLGKFN